MNKDILNEYIDSCELVRETEQDIKRLNKRKKTLVVGSVKGSMPEFPYAEQRFHVEGVQYSYNDDRQLRYEEKLLVERKESAEKIKLNVEQFMNTVPVRMQRIIRLRFFEGLNWEQVADKMGRKATGNSIKKEFQRFLEKY